MPMTCTQLTGNGVTPFPEYAPGNVVGMMQILDLTYSDAGEDDLKRGAFRSRGH